MRKIAKSKIMKFLDDFSVLASRLGGRETSEERLHESSGRFYFETNGGTLTARANSGIDYTIFARFEDGDKAAIALGYKQTGEREYPWGKRMVFDSGSKRLAPYSGKWNFHGDDAQSILSAFESELTPLLQGREASA